MLQQRVLPIEATPVEPVNETVRYSPDLAPGIIHGLELALVVASGLVLWSIPALSSEGYFQQHLSAIAFVTFIFSNLSNWASLVHVNALMRPLTRADDTIIAIMTSFLFLLSVLFAFDIVYMFEPRWLMAFAASTVVGVLGVRLAAFGVLRRLSRRQVLKRNLAVLGTEAQGAQLLRKIARDQPYFAEVVGVYALDAPPGADSIEGFPVRGTVEDLLRAARAGSIDDVVVALPWSADRKVVETIERLKELPVDVFLGSDLVGFDLSFRPVLGAFSQLPVYKVVERPISGWSSAAKRLLDYTCAGLGLLLLAPVLAVIAVAIRIESPGPVFFRQQRLGFNNKVFWIYKFRSMYHRRDEDRERVTPQARRGDPRITQVGRIIRATSLDELPQLFNVLNGTMSLVGPRPHALSHNEEYGAQIRGYFARHKVKPGITGWAQVKGLRGETADIARMRARVEHDIYYAENWSLLLDLRILIGTLLVVLFQKTAY